MNMNTSLCFSRHGVLIPIRRLGIRRFDITDGFQRGVPGREERAAVLSAMSGFEREKSAFQFHDVTDF